MLRDFLLTEQVLSLSLSYSFLSLILFSLSYSFLSIFLFFFLFLDRGTTRLWRSDHDKTVAELFRKGSLFLLSFVLLYFLIFLSLSSGYVTKFPFVVDTGFSPSENTLFTICLVSYLFCFFYFKIISITKITFNKNKNKIKNEKIKN